MFRVWGSSSAVLTALGILAGGTVLPGAALAQDAANPAPPPILGPRSEGPGPTLAPTVTGEKPPPPNTTGEPMAEITIIAPRRSMGDFQSIDEFYRAEFEKIRGEFERAPQAPLQDWETFETGGMTESPNTRSDLKDLITGAPRLRDTLSKGPPKADPTPK